MSLGLLLAAFSGLQVKSAWAQGPSGQTETSTTTAESALSVAAAAFEYRDFGRVVKALYPWVHPPRIRERTDMVEARRLLGVSYHVLGQVDLAREEFAQLILLDPGHQLDPFVVPPDVIATFQDVARRMGPPPETPPPTLSLSTQAAPPPRLASLLPLGLNHWALDDPVWGVLMGAGQVSGLALNMWAFTEAKNFPDPSRERDQLVAAQYIGLGILGLSYAVSVLQANLVIDERERLRLESSRVTN